MKSGNSEYITDVFLHSTAEGFGKGVKTSKDEVVDLLKEGAKITNHHLELSFNTMEIWRKSRVHGT